MRSPLLSNSPHGALRLVVGSAAATRGYDATESGLVASRLIGAPNIVADGGLCSTVRDLARLPGALAGGTS